MEIDIKEGTACVRALVSMAKADGKITAEERAALQTAIEMLPSGGDLAPFLDETTTFEKVIADVRSPVAREQLWFSAFSMVHADGSASPEEQQLLEKMRTTFGIDAAKASSMKRLLDETKDTLLLSNIDRIDDPVRRHEEIEQDVLKYSVLSAILGAFPVPGVAVATDLAIVALQVKLVRDIGQYWGHTLDKTAAKSLLGGLGLGTGARIAVSNLAKLVPVWGSAFGAASAFATTWALGKITNRYFEGGRPQDVAALKNEMKAMQKQGKDAYAKQRATIEAKRAETAAKLAALTEQRKAGTIGQADYEKQVSEL